MASSTAADPQEPSVTGPRAPFDDEDADLIIRCPDGAEFWVYKSILGRASPVFKEMFAFPSNQEYRDGVLVIHVSEEAHAMALLLTLGCYPMKAPELKTFEDIRAAAEAGRKYVIAELVQVAREALPVFAETNAPLAYVLACVFRWSQEARAAAKLTLRQPWDAMCRPSPQLNCIDTSDYCKLQDYYSRCWRAVIAISSASLNDYCIPRSCNLCSKLKDQTPYWFRTYVDAIFPALRERPCGSTVTDSYMVNYARELGLKCSNCQHSVHSSVASMSRTGRRPDCEDFARPRLRIVRDVPLYVLLPNCFSEICRAVGVMNDRHVRETWGQGRLNAGRFQLCSKFARVIGVIWEFLDHEYESSIAQKVMTLVFIYFQSGMLQQTMNF